MRRVGGVEREEEGRRNPPPLPILRGCNCGSGMFAFEGWKVGKTPESGGRRENVEVCRCVRFIFEGQTCALNKTQQRMQNDSGT